MKQPELQLNDVCVYHDSRRLCQISTTVSAGSILTITGPSGTGKSSLLAALAGLLPPVMRMSGQILLGKRDISAMPAHERQLGMLFQDPLLFEHMTVAQNIAFGMPAEAGRDKASLVRRMLKDVGLEGFCDKPVQTLSGGQQARVALLRTLASRPAALLLDEPFSKLDSATRYKTREWVFDQIRSYQLPAVLVTHDEQDSHSAGGQIIGI
ncbi:ATP-binding cassette domain-containing protein [Salinimonas lutimaris]|uniref:ATP-binding cassette domain-containing protein n=1 Tax=Salinimonas lutimaris TaxID=914153 RepID=UPI0010C0F741|nr:ATP-binding cassette domain-containing protein [Salinimonas lutimaris]